MRRKREKPEEVARSYVKTKKDRDGFLVQQVPLKGRGVFASQKFEKGDFLLEYCGKLLTGEEGDILEQNISTGFRFFFKSKGQEFCIDASEEPSIGPTFGRLVNHGQKDELNVKLTVVDIEGTPALCLFALRDIQEGEELLYNYGVKQLPWLQQQSKVSINAAKNRKETESDKESGNGDETMDERDHADNIKPFQVSNKCFSTGNSNLQNTANITL
ncbi:N-lysine methyltransferase KMT5A-A-like isoform X2 [Apostichopus japonicus]